MARKVPKYAMFELDGPGLNPENVDSIALLRAAEAFFSLAVKIAEAGQLGLSFRGLHVLDKCVAIAAIPSSPKAAQLAMPKAIRVVRGTDPAPVGAETSMVHARRALRVLDPNLTASFGVGKRLQRVVAPDLPLAESPWEAIELRVVPLRVGGKENSVELSSASEPEPFIVKATLEDARRLGGVLKSEIDVRLEICRDVDGRIERGNVVEVLPMNAGDPAEAWQTWFAEQEPDWDAIENVGDGLGRAH